MTDRQRHHSKSSSGTRSGRQRRQRPSLLLPVVRAVLRPATVYLATRGTNAFAISTPHDGRQHHRGGGRIGRGSGRSGCQADWLVGSIGRNQPSIARVSRRGGGDGRRKVCLGSADSDDEGETGTGSEGDAVDEAQIPVKPTSLSSEELLGEAVTIRAGGSGADLPPPAQPTLAQIRNFAIPCLALWISGPLLSLVDTATVGLSALPGEGAAQLGALGPATTFIDGATYLFAFLNVATTNLYASAVAKCRDPDDEAARIRAGDGVARTATKIALIAGVGLLALLLKVGHFLLGVYIGGDAGGHILGPASDYVNIRALSMPTTLLSGVLQAALLGAKDSVTPLISILYSTVVNVFGDVILVNRMRMGIQGAAIATLLAQWAGTAAMIGPARRELFAPVPTAKARDGGDRVSSKSFLTFALPVLTLILGKIAAFGVMTHVAAALPGEAALAAHQIVLSLFFFVSPFLEVISQTAQAFLPQYYAPPGGADAPPAEWTEQANVLSGRLLRIGFAVAAVVASAAASVPRFFPWALTNDPAVMAAVRPLALPLAVGGLLTAPVAVSEGVLLARRELRFLAGVYVGSTALLPPVLFRIKRDRGPVAQVWVAFAGFQLFRAVCFTGRLWGPRVWKGLSSRRRAGGSGKEHGGGGVAVTG